MLDEPLSAQQILETVQETGIGIWECDINTGEMYCSNNVYEIFGLRRDDFEHTLQHFLTFFPAPDRATFLKQWQAAIRGAGPLDLVHRVARPGLPVCHVRQVGRLVETHGRKLISATVRNVTDEHFKKSRWKILNSIALKLNDMVVITEADMIDEPGPRIVYVNEAFTARTGYDRSEVIGRSPRMLQGPNTQASELARIRAALRASETVRAELVNYTKGGEEFWVELEISPMFDDDGQYTHWVAVERDITERKLSDQALRRSEAQFRAGFEAAAVGETLSEPLTGAIIRANRAFGRMLGYETGELIGQTIWDLTWPEDRAAELTEYGRTLDGEREAYVREKRFVRRNGSPVWGRVSVSVVRISDAVQPLLTVSIIEDIDESHRAKSALEKAKADLEHLLNERTAALAQRDLLLREVYHRVKNNLQIVDSLLMMQAAEVADVGAKAAFLGMRGRLYALGLVHQQLMTSSNLSTFDISSFLHELSDNIVVGGAGPNVKLELTVIPLDVGLDFAIPLGLVVTELVTNCLKHAAFGGQTTIAVTLSQAADGEIVLVVADNGRGYAEDPRAGSTDGALGTRIIRGMVKQLGGTIAVTTKSGTRTEVRLPGPTTP